MITKISKVDTEKIIIAVLQGKSFDEVAKEFSTSQVPLQETLQNGKRI